MARVLCQVCLVFLSTIALSAQGTYPLQKGNLWQYWTWDYLYGQITWTYGWTTRVVSDTTMPNGVKYSVLRSDGLYGTNAYMRQDSSKVLVYTASPPDSEHVRYDFSKTTGDTMFISYLPQAHDTIVQVIAFDRFVDIFGMTRRQMGYYTFSKSSTSYVLEEITDGFGLTADKAEGGEQWFLRGATIDGMQYGVVTSVDEHTLKTTAPSCVLCQNYPNPFNNSTTISFEIPITQRVTITIFDILGREVRKLLDENLSGGRHQVAWDGKLQNGSVSSSGTYICRMEAGALVQSRLMIFLK